MFQCTLAGLIVALVVASSSVEAQGGKPVAVTLVSVDPGASSGDGDWCIGADRVMLTAQVVDVASQTLVKKGTIVWQVCEARFGGFPKEDCDSKSGARWVGAVISDLSFDSTPSIGTTPQVPVLGFRLQYRPAKGSGFQSATSQSFNLDQTCSQ